MLYKKISELPSGVVAADGDLLEISRQLTDAKKSYSISVSAVYDNFSAKIKPDLDDKLSGSIYQNPDTKDGTGIGLHWQGNGGAGEEGLPNFQYFLISDKTKTPIYENLITKTYFEKYTKDFVTSENVPKPDLSSYITGNFATYLDSGDGQGYDLHYTARYGGAPLFRYKTKDGSVHESSLISGSALIEQKNNDGRTNEIHYDGVLGGIRVVYTLCNTNETRTSYAIDGSPLDGKNNPVSGHIGMGLFANENEEAAFRYFKDGVGVITKILGANPTINNSSIVLGDLIINFGFVSSNGTNSIPITYETPFKTGTFFAGATNLTSNNKGPDFSPAFSLNDNNSGFVTIKNISGGSLNGAGFCWFVFGK